MGLRSGSSSARFFLPDGMVQMIDNEEEEKRSHSDLKSESAPFNSSSAAAGHKYCENNNFEDLAFDCANSQDAEAAANMNFSDGTSKSTKDNDTTYTGL